MGASTQDLQRQLDAIQDAVNYNCRQNEHIIRQNAEILKYMKRANRPIVTVHQPNGEVSMSGQQPTTLPGITITLPPAGSSQSPGWFNVFPIGITNSDGTAPTVTLSNPGTINGGTVQGPDASGQYGYSGTAAVAGQVNVSFLADGVVNYILPVTVQPQTAETLNIPATAIATGAPGTSPPAFT